MEEALFLTKDAPNELTTKEIFIYSLINERYELKGEFNFLEEEIISSKFENLVVDMKDIELYEDDEFSI